MLLTKSDFQAARTCDTKLYYRKKGYPSTLDEDPYLDFLAYGGYMVEAIARLLFPSGQEIVADSFEEGIDTTRNALERDEVVLFQPIFRYQQFLAQVDILAKCGNHIQIVEVKSSSVEPEEGRSPFRGRRNQIYSKWRPYLEDITYQTFILRSLFPNAQLSPCLCVVDKTQTSSSGTAFENFHIRPRGKDRMGGFRQPLITFTGDLNALQAQPFVRIFDVTAEVEELLPLVTAEAARFAETLTGNEPTRIHPDLAVKCKKCEYRENGLAPNGFRDCWGELSERSPHLLDLYRVDQLKSEVIGDMVTQGKTSLLDVLPSNFSGGYGERQSIQLEYTKRNQEFLDPELPRLLAARAYPLHFIDFEATRMAVPYHSGMQPYGLVAFEWSCHTIPAPGAELVHNEWINVNDAYPNFEFATALKRVVTGEGTVFVWSSFEVTVLKDIKDHLAWYTGGDNTLGDWLESLIAESGPIIDLYKLAGKHYFHPDMVGSVSIKKVMPSIWFHDSTIRNHRWFSEYLNERDGQVLDPYETLRPLRFGGAEATGEGETVREGTAAIRTYHDMMYGAGRSDTALREDMRSLLREYCKLDTAAMVMIWMHWMNVGNSGGSAT